MLPWRKMLILFSILSVVALLGPAAALATGPSAGDQQYVDPLGGSNGSSGSHHSSSGSHSSSSGSSSNSGSSSSQPVTSTPTTTPVPSTTTPSATTSSSSPTTPSNTPTATTAATTAVPSAKPGDPTKTLPRTGFDVWLGAAIGLGMLTSGLYLRRTARGT